jgi:hypothetical protein
MSNEYWIEENEETGVKDYWFIDDAAVLYENSDGTWSVGDNGDEIDGLDYKTAMSYAIEFALTDEDVEEWHNGTMTPHLKKVWESFPRKLVFQVWGSRREGGEPLSVLVTDEEMPA